MSVRFEPVTSTLSVKLLNQKKKKYFEILQVLGFEPSTPLEQMLNKSNLVSVRTRTRDHFLLIALPPTTRAHLFLTTSMPNLNIYDNI